MTLAAKLLMAGAIVPAGVNPSLLVVDSQIQLALCGQGLSSVSIPGQPLLPGSGSGLCCAKGCHTGQDRKRAKSDNRN